MRASHQQQMPHTKPLHSSISTFTARSGMLPWSTQTVATMKLCHPAMWESQCQTLSSNVVVTEHCQHKPHLGGLRMPADCSLTDSKCFSSFCGFLCSAQTCTTCSIKRLLLQ